VPGKTPHPVSDPAGHSFGTRNNPVTEFDPTRWRECRPYLRGIDLFNHGYYWEAHEAWEALWHAAGRAGPVADFVKALIQLAVAGVKHLEGKPEGMRTHALRAAELARASGFDELSGLKAEEIVRIGEQVTQEGWPAEGPVLLPR
jgi:predicted metal-dependent hydrolase